jgi:RNA polymerase nonessential primary-like sigma factor
MNWDDDWVVDLEPEQDSRPLRFDRDTGPSESVEPSNQPARGEDLADLYRKDLARCKSLNPEQEAHVARLARAGDASAIRVLVESQLGLVNTIALNYRHCGIPQLDLVEEGNLGLIHAVETFDPERGVRFGDYAYFWVRKWISAAINHQLRLVYLPREILAMLNERTERLRAKRHTSFFVKLKPASRFARLRGIPTDAANFEEIVSLGPNGEYDGLGSDSEHLSEDGYAAMVDALSEDAAVRRLHDWMSRLSPCEGEILCRRFGLFGFTVETAEAIAERMELLPRYVYGLTRKALQKLRAMAEAEGFDVDAVFH